MTLSSYESIILRHVATAYVASLTSKRQSFGRFEKGIFFGKHCICLFMTSNIVEIILIVFLINSVNFSKNNQPVVELWTKTYVGVFLNNNFY